MGFMNEKTIRIEKINNALSFLKLVKPLLLEKESEYSLMLGIAGLRVAKTIDDCIYFVLFDRNELIGCSVLSKKNFVVTQIPEPFLLTIANYLKKENYILPGIVGDPATSERFAYIWSNLINCKYKLAMDQKIYQLNEVLLPSNLQGKLINARLDHTELVGKWLFEFSCESLPHEPTTLENSTEFAKQKINNCDVYLLQSLADELVSMNFVGRPTDHGITVSAVYTPKVFRRKGYASAIVAKTSQLMIQNGRKFCVLYTDMANPTSNKIYQKIGYKEVALSKQFIFNY